jgi:uncharacterized protein (TIGR02145 family)
MYCPDCGTENLEIANFCKKCRHEFLKKEIILCPKCKAENEKMSLFCNKCAEPFTKTNIIPEKKVHPSQKNEIVWLNDKNGHFIDPRDGQKYKIVRIGTQIWMAENLRYKLYSGCWVYENKAENAKKYGYLYDWKAAKTVSMTGWHLPAKTEMETLYTFLGNDPKKVYLAIKEGGSSGFNALFGGCKGSLWENGFYATFWTSSAFSFLLATNLFCDSSQNTAVINADFPQSRYSVRLLLNRI